jgi:NAD(P)-dependent dehydrogenase (short-subunit alcohol dehydrogenase family)
MKGKNMDIDTSAVPDYRQLSSLAGRTAVVVGAGNGIGRQTAHALAARDASILCVDIEEDRARHVAQEVGGHALVTDVTTASGAREVVEAVKNLPPVKTIVDIVGMSAFAWIPETSDELWASSRRINLDHAIQLLRHVAPAVADAGGGTMVFVASISGMYGATRHAAYGAHKAALMSLVRSAAVELGPSGIRVNAVAPGVIWTDRIGGAIGEERRGEWTGRTPTGRLGSPSDIASTLAYLATDESAHVNGQTIVIDGGLGTAFPYPVEAL